MNARTYRGYTLSEAQSELQVWKAAKRYAAAGKSYTVGTRSLTRYDPVSYTHLIIEGEK